MHAKLASAVALAFVIAPLAALPPAAAEGPVTFAEAARALVAREARAHGLDPDEVLAMPFTLVAEQPDGSSVELTAPFGAMLDKLGQGQLGADAGGIAGTPELTVGDLAHLYVNIRIGNALGYGVTNSAVVPSTPPVILPPPATILFFDVGGPLRNIKGSYLLGAHTVGTVIGSNVDTAASGPYVPVLTGGLVQDRKIDFLGHSLYAQGQFCIFGLCFAAGAMLADGVVAWDTTAVDLPRVP